MQVSIIIPCYNSGAYLREALDSIISEPVAVEYEVIIVDDGSTDAQTIALFKELRAEGYHIISQENKGPAGARNEGIRASRGKYIFFLDSDNRIKPAYLSKAAAVLDAHPEVGIVYSMVSFFGSEAEPRYEPAPFNLGKILICNYIDMCAMVRKEVWTQIGDMDEDRLLMGHADWEFWIRAAANKWKFHFIEEVLYEYRVLNDSLITTTYSPDKYEKIVRKIYSKYINIGFFDFLYKIHTPLPYYFMIFKMDKGIFYDKFLKKLGIRKTSGTSLK